MNKKYKYLVVASSGIVSIGIAAETDDPSNGWSITVRRTVGDVVQDTHWTISPDGSVAALDGGASDEPDIARYVSDVARMMEAAPPVPM